MPLLPRKGVLAVAAVIDVAMQAQGQPISAKALAARHGLPPRHLEPVLQALVRHGILKGVRGPRGGYELAREQRRITADDILRAAGTVEERRYWSAYRKAYEAALTRCNTQWAPWCVVPANHKWYRNLVVARVVVETLRDLHMQYPEPAIDLSKVKID